MQQQEPLAVQGANIKRNFLAMQNIKKTLQCKVGRTKKKKTPCGAQRQKPLAMQGANNYIY